MAMYTSTSTGELVKINISELFQEKHTLRTFFTALMVEVRSECTFWSSLM